MIQFEEYQKITKEQQCVIINYFKKMAEPYKEEIQELETLDKFMGSVRIPVYAEYSRDIPFIDVLNSLVKTINFFPSTNQFNNQLAKELETLRDKMVQTQERITEINNSLGFVADQLSKDFTYDCEKTGSFHNRIDAIRNLNYSIVEGYFNEEQQKEMVALFKLNTKDN